MTFNYARLRAPLSTVIKWQFPVLVSLILFTCMHSYGQQKKVIALQNVSMEAAIRRIEATYQVKFFYAAGTLPVGHISLSSKARNIKELLNELESATNLQFRLSGNMVGVTPAYSPTEVSKTKPMVVGAITDRKGQPLPGATIRDAITGKGSVTDANGTFTIVAEAGHPLVISSIGYRQQTQVASGKEQRIVMEEDATSLGGIVVMGYTNKQAAELTGAVQKISGEQLRSSVSSANILSMLKAKTTGMYIVEPNADAGGKGQVLLRGQSSLPSGTSAYFGPLIVVDGVISNSQNLQDVVSPADVESVTILKDAASTAIYGSRAAQGVIVVTTKKASPNSGVHVTLDTRYGAIKQNRAIHMMNTTEVTTLMDKVMQRRWEETPTLQQQFPTAADFIRQRRIYTDEDKNTNYDWEKAMFDDGNFSDVSLGLNSGNDKTTVYAGIDWYKEKGINSGNTFDRRNLRLNLTQKFSKKVSGGLNTSAIIDKTISRNGVPALYSTQPFVTPYKTDGSFADSIPVKQSNNFGVPYTTWSQNFIGEKKYDNTTVTNNQHFTGTVWLNYQVLPWLNLKTTNTIDYINTHRNSYLDPRGYSGKYGGFPYLFTPASSLLPNGTLTIADTRFFNFISTNTLSASKQFGQHSLNFLAGTEWSKRTNESNSTDMYNLLPGERNMGAAKNFGSAINVAYNTPYRPSGTYTERASFSAFSELNYNYLAKYYAAASLRTDAFTNFGRNKRYGTFYAISGGWLINKEAFLADIKAIDVLKLRVVHGTSGRDVGDGYLNQTLYASNSNYTYDNVNNVGSAITQLENPDISWETTVNNTAGIDLGLWKRIELSADLYAKLSKNLLQQVFVGSAQGSFQQYQNVGEVMNKGLEIMLNTRNIDTRKFSWTTNLNVSFNKNTIQKLYGDSLLDNYNRAYYRYVGEDLNVIKAVRYTGVNPDNGAPLFENFDASGKKQVVEGIGDFSNVRNYQTVGSATPKFFGGFTNTFTYKQFSLSAEMWFQVGNYTAMNLINNFQSPTAPFLGRNNVNWQSSQKIWQQPGDKNANYPNIYSSKMDAWRVFDSRSSLIYGNASHIRMRNIRLGYDLAEKTLTKIHAQRAGVFVSIDNVFVIKHKDYVGADPEGASIGTSTAYGGVGIGNANPRRITAGLNVTF